MTDNDCPLRRFKHVRTARVTESTEESRLWLNKWSTIATNGCLFRSNRALRQPMTRQRSVLCPTGYAPVVDTTVVTDSLTPPLTRRTDAPLVGEQHFCGRSSLDITRHRST